MKYNDPTTDQVGQVRVQNLASFQALGTLISTTVEYLGCATAELALRLAQRDLQVNSSNLRRLTIKMDRAGWTIAPGHVFKISAPTRGIESMILRAGNIEDSPITEGTITITAVQDVFTLPSTSFVSPQPSLWTPPDRSARIVGTRALIEATYYDLSENLPSAQLAQVDMTSGAIKIFAKQPAGACIDYEVYDEADGEPAYQVRNIAGWDAGCKIQFSIGPYDTQFTYIDEFNFSAVAAGQPLLIDDEYCEIASIDTSIRLIHITRGCIDTVPAPHSANAVVWFQTAAPTSDFREYSTSELIHVKLLTRTVTETLDPAIAPTDDITITGRQGRPYPPGNFRANGTPVFNRAIVDGDIELAWAHRDRITEGNFLVDTAAFSVGPEPGTTYTVRVYDGADPVPTTLIRTVTGITGTDWTYTVAMATADGGLTSFWFQVESSRDSLTSHQRWQFHINRSVGFDDGFDDNFDG